MPKTPAITPLVDRIWLHLSQTHRHVIDPADIYWLDAHDNDTLIRHRDRKRLRDVRK